MTRWSCGTQRTTPSGRARPTPTNRRKLTRRSPARTRPICRTSAAPPRSGPSASGRGAAPARRAPAVQGTFSAGEAPDTRPPRTPGAPRRQGRPRPPAPPPARASGWAGDALGDATVDALVQVRMARQSILTRPNPVEVRAVIHESALQTNANRPDIMGPQLDKLLTLSRLTNVNIQVMPAGAAVHPGVSGAFALMGFPQRRDLDIVFVEGLLNGLWVEDPADVELYRAKFQEVTAEALPVDASLDFITAQRERIK
ncbi:DUF5753 domain-containing protein [Kitasatospora sp. NPDC008115]|uniref:DUF5753 domain-containing protein n=1 Tax=Kitasatospora sp. NPDC008115 TaxID=3364022 RepID=UPI0036E049E2